MLLLAEFKDSNKGPISNFSFIRDELKAVEVTVLENKSLCEYDGLGGVVSSHPSGQLL